MIDLNAPIVPSHSAAGVTLGQSIDDVLAHHAPTETEFLSVVLKYRFGPVELCVQSGRVTQIGLTNGYQGKVLADIGVGSSIGDVENSLGSTIKDRDGNTIVDGSKGWCMDVEDETIAGIYVFSLDDTETEAGFDWQEAAEQCIAHLTWSGFYQPRELTRIVCEDVLDALDFDEQWVRDRIKREYAAKKKAEREWPKLTDCDRLDQAFSELTGAGIASLHNAGYTLSEGIEIVAEVLQQSPELRGYCFYHGQDVENALEGHGLYLAFGSSDDDDAKSREIGDLICCTLRDVGLQCAWDGTTDVRIHLTGIDWQRRLKRRS